VVFTYRTNSSRLSPTMQRVRTDCTRGTDVTARGSSTLSKLVRTSRVSTKVARNTAKVALVIRLRTKSRTTRGVNWPLAICTATSEMLKTTPMKVIIAEPTALTTAFASSANRSSSSSVSKSRSSRSASTRAVSSSSAPAQTTKTPTIAAVGANQNVSRKCSLSGDRARGRRLTEGLCVTIQSLMV
jgi:hypothetical protein